VDKLEDSILQESYNLTVSIMDKFVVSQALNVYQIEGCNVESLKSYCQGYFVAMFLRNVTMVSMIHHMPITYQPSDKGYEIYAKKICTHEKLDNIINDLV